MTKTIRVPGQNLSDHQQMSCILLDLKDAMGQLKLFILW